MCDVLLSEFHVLLLYCQHLALALVSQLYGLGFDVPRARKSVLSLSFGAMMHLMAMRNHVCCADGEVGGRKGERVFQPPIGTF